MVAWILRRLKGLYKNDDVILNELSEVKNLYLSEILRYALNDRKY